MMRDASALACNFERRGMLVLKTTKFTQLAIYHNHMQVTQKSTVRKILQRGFIEISFLYKGFTLQEFAISCECAPSHLFLRPRPRLGS